MACRQPNCIKLETSLNSFGRRQALNVSGYFMWTLATILTAISSAYSIDCRSFEKKSLNDQANTSCKTERDLLTKRIVYTTADKEAENEGGQSALMRQFVKITLDSIPEDLDTKFIIGFIVETDGRITGERAY